MAKFSWRKAAVVAAVVPLVALSACSSQGGKPADSGGGAGAGQVAGTDRIKVALITHAAAGDTFWDIVRKGAEEASSKDNVELLYTSDPEAGRQAQLVQQAIDQKVDGIAVTVATPDALKDVLKKATDAGIPVVSLNAGESVSSQLGAFTHFGSNEQLAGEAVGTRLASEGYKHPVCVIQQQGHVGLEARCAGVKAKVPATEILYVDGKDMTAVQSTATAKLQASKDADVIIGLGAPITLTLLKSVTDAGSSSKVASFDLNAELAQKIVDGQVIFTVDQQPWLQGYMSVDALWQAKRGGFKIGGGQPVLTGPTIVDKAERLRRPQVRPAGRPLDPGSGCVAENRHQPDQQESFLWQIQQLCRRRGLRPLRDERVGRRSPVQKFLARPEVGALVGAVVLFIFFASVSQTFTQPNALATVLYGSSTIGIMAVGVSLLMIGGEFDLSTGVAVISSALTASLFSWNFSLNAWVGVTLALVVSLGIGFINGWILVKTKLPSFIVTLATFLMLTGLNLGLTRLIGGSVSSPSISKLDGFESARAVFASSISIGGVEVKITVFFWIVLVAVASWILLRTRVGNWIFAVGGDANAARAVGVPVTKTKIGLFMAVGFCGWILGMHNLFAFDAVQSGEGVGNEFLYIIAAVIGGCLLTGGYGSAVGGAIGAFIFGMANKGIVYAQWNPDWFKFFLGLMLLLATIVNLIVKRRAELK